MENATSKIAIIGDDFSADEFEKLIRKDISDDQAVIQSVSLEKSGRSDNDLIHLIFSNEMAVNLLAAIIYDVVKYGLDKLSKAFGSKPAAIITLSNDMEIRLFRKMGDEEIQKRILQVLENESVKSIEFQD